MIGRIEMGIDKVLGVVDLGMGPVGLRRSAQRLLCAFAMAGVFWGGACHTAKLSAQAISPLSEWAEDASLNDVFFLDPDLGWVVGDRGVILRTTDGGRRWENVVSPVECKLDGVFFLNARDGWIVGGFAQPVTHLSTGVVLRTVDGGKTWRRISNDRLPWMKQVRMETERVGWGISHRSPIFPSGLMMTQDGGASWRPYPGDVQGEWTGGVRLGVNEFALIGRNRTAAVARQGALETAFVWPTGSFDLLGMVMVDDQHGWAAGDAGTLLMTRDGGGAWDEPPAPLDARIASQFDWRTVAAKGDRVWVAGSPGTRIGRSLDQGRTWEWVDTESSFPINRIFFWDENRGWAIGAMGTIHSTMDGGKSWRASRKPTERVAIYGMFGSKAEIPLEFFARHCGNDGHYAAVGVVGKVKADEPSVSSLHDRLRLALSNTGVSGFSLDRSAFRQGRDTPSRDRMKELLVREIRVWRPEVVVCGAVDEPFSDEQLELALVKEAIIEAADESRFSDQLSEAGLTAWRTSKLFTRSGADDRVDEVLPINQFAPRLGTSLEDHCLVENGLIKSFGFDWEMRQGWRFIETDPTNGLSSNSIANRSLFAGIAPDRLRNVQRTLSPPGPGNLEVMRRQARKWEWIERITTTANTNDGDPGIWMREVEGLLIGIGELGGGNVLFQLAHAHEANGQYEAAARSMHLLVTDYPDHPLWDGAILWLIRYYSSAEARWLLHPDAIEPHIRIANSEETTEDEFFGVKQDDQVQRVGFHDPVQVPFSLRQRIDERHISDVGVDERTSHARKLIQTLARRRPMVAALAPVEVSQAAVDRIWTGMQITPAQTISSARQAGGLWAHLGEIEHWLREAIDAPPVPVLLCRAIPNPPKLDGRLDDEIWKQTPAVALGLLNAESSSGKSSTSIRVAYDREFLFIAIECDKHAELPPNEKSIDDKTVPRERDTDLSQQDRFCISIDVDRDYASAFVLEIDQRGWCRDTALGLESWNPQWFIAAGNDVSTWQAEVAVPFSQLGVATPIDRDAWAISLRRCLAGEDTPLKTMPFLGEPQVDSILMFIE